MTWRRGGGVWWVLFVIVGCGESTSLDPATPVNELDDEEAVQLCEESLSPLLDDEYLELACTYAAVDNMIDPAMCRSDRAECLSLEYEPTDIESACRAEPRDPDCAVTVGEFLECRDAYESALREFFAEFSCDEASADPVPDPPPWPSLAGCAEVARLCPTAQFFY